MSHIYNNLDIYRVFSDDFAILSEEVLEIDMELVEKSISIEDITFNLEVFKIKEKKIFSFHDLELLR